MRIAPISDRVTAVLVGNLNPAIFHPAWFALNKLVSKEDAANAIVRVIHPELSNFDVGELSIQVDKQRFAVACPGRQHEMLRDLIVGSFGNILSHTPIQAMGINREVHFDTGDFAVRQAVGETLAPKAPWGEWGDILETRSNDPHLAGGLLVMTMREVRDNKDKPGWVQAEVQPSALQPIRRSGILMTINNHYEVRSAENEGDVERLIQLLDSEWMTSINKSDFIVDQIQALAERIKTDLGKRR